MKKAKMSRRIVRTIIVLMIIIIGLSACDVNPNAPDTAPATTSYATTSEPSAHVCVFSDWVTVKEASTTEEGLRERKCECGQVEQEIIQTSNTEFYIQYKNLKSAEYPSETGYNSKDGLLDLPQPETVGYKFIGWYTASVGGEIVDYILPGSKKDYILFAHWEPITYNIFYENAPENNNPLTYTIEDTIVLKNPGWSGMIFINWVDENGVPITRIEQGTTGDRTIKATWKTHENVVVSTGSNGAFVGEYIPELEEFLFIYELGTIYNVVLDSTIEPVRKTANSTTTVTISQSTTIEESHAKTVAQSIANSVTQSVGWNTVAQSTFSNSQSKEIITGGEGGVEIKIFKQKLSNSFGITTSHSQNWSYATETSTNRETGNTETKELSSTVAYTEQISLTEEISREIPSSAPEGNYYGVHAGDIRLFAVIIYNPITDEYNITTYSVLTNVYDTILYSALYQEYEHVVYGITPFEVPIDKIINTVNSSYCIKYDANGGVGEMPISIHPYNENSHLLSNQYSNEGYLFSGWEYVKLTDTGEEIITLKNQDSNLASIIPTRESNTTKTPVIILKAIWTPCTYKVVYNYNVDGTEAIMESSTHTYNTSMPLNKNNFERTGYTFAGWNTQPDGSGTSFADEEIVCNLSSSEEPFHLYAIWTPHKYTIVYEPNKGDGTTTVNGTISNSYHTYGEEITLTANGYSRIGWEFKGWNTSPDGSGKSYQNNEIISNLTDEDNGIVKLYAVWELITYASGTWQFEETLISDSPKGIVIDLGSHFDLAYLNNNNTPINITASWAVRPEHKKTKAILSFYCSNTGGYTLDNAQKIDQTEAVYTDNDVIRLSIPITANMLLNQRFLIVSIKAMPTDLLHFNYDLYAKNLTVEINCG